MAKIASKAPDPSNPFDQLPREVLEAFKGIEGEIDEAEKDRDAMEELGMDTSRDRERIAWARKAIEVMTKRLTERKP